MFDRNSANSVTDLLAVVSEETSPALLSLLSELVEELEKQEYLQKVSDKTLHRHLLRVLHVLHLLRLSHLMV